MFFQKKKKAAATTPAELRTHYRKRASKSQRLEATLRVEGWEPVDVELLDLTIRGAGIRLPFAADRNLKQGDVVELVIGNMMRHEVTTPAKVASVKPEAGSHMRYGLEFVNLGNLYSQLDSFYARHFNRRKFQRVIPSLDRKLHATLRWNASELQVHVYDLSECGMGLVLTRDSAARVAELNCFEVSFKLPGEHQEILVGVTVKQRTVLHQQVLLGLEFDTDGAHAVTPYRLALRGFVERRAAEMALWEAKTPKSKTTKS